MKLLLVEDEENTVGFLQRGLREEGFVVDVARTAGEADLAVHDHDYDAVLLDVMLPGEDGFSLCRRWRARGLNLPVLFVTARDALPDRVEGLNLGADDYLVKPFAFEELLARLHARLRRRQGSACNQPIRVGALELDLVARQARLSGVLLDLTGREFSILELLATHANQVVTRAQIWEQAWETGSEPASNVVDVYVGYVRQKLGEGRGLIQTVRGLGYRLSVAEA
ncbi:MAG: response regulator transcription factor [Vulcanimicrobiota bacterium]